MQASGPRGVLAAALRGDPLEMVAGQAAGQVNAMDRNLPRVELGDLVDRSLGKFAVGEQEHGVGLERNRLFHGGPRVGAAVGLDQPQPARATGSWPGGRPFGAWARRASASTRCCRRSPRTSAAPASANTLLRSFDRGAGQAIVVEHAAGAIDDVDEELAAGADAEKRRFPPGGKLVPVVVLGVAIVGIAARRPEKLAAPFFHFVLGEDTDFVVAVRFRSLGRAAAAFFLALGAFAADVSAFLSAVALDDFACPPDSAAMLVESPVFSFERFPACLPGSRRRRLAGRLSRKREQYD